LDYIRFIDVKQNSIKKFADFRSSEIRYAALSYVWGSYPAIKLKIDNVEQLQQPGFLGTLQLPQTITGASELASMLGIDYLWVDALCIIQDDDEDKKYQISKMGSIYNSAFLTIVAASENDSDASLPGLQPDTRFFNQEEIVVLPPSEQNEGISLMTTINTQATNRGEFFIDALEDIDQSKWNNRAWTMQERVLSRRNIIFTKEQVL